MKKYQNTNIAPVKIVIIFQKIYFYFILIVFLGGIVENK